MPHFTKCINYRIGFHVTSPINSSGVTRAGTNNPSNVFIRRMCPNLLALAKWRQFQVSRKSHLWKDAMEHDFRLLDEAWHWVLVSLYPCLHKLEAKKIWHLAFLGWPLRECFRPHCIPADRVLCKEKRHLLHSRKFQSSSNLTVFILFLSEVSCFSRFVMFSRMGWARVLTCPPFAGSR